MMNDKIVDDLSRLPSNNSLFFWCDYIELCCIASIDKILFLDYFLEIKQEVEDIQTDTDLFERDDYSCDIREQEDEEDIPPEREDRQYRAMRDRFLHLSMRSGLFGDDLYPFIINGNKISLKRDLNENHCLYIQLMVSSVLSYVPRRRRQELTESFENISYNIFKQLMPYGWEVHSFGKQQSERYTGKLYSKLSNLANDIRGCLRVKETGFRINDNGDGGLDLVAWHPMADNHDLIPIAFAQCGCSPNEFESKMLQASPAKLGSILCVGHSWSNYYFMPQSMHDENDWLQRSDMGSAIVIDRLRIMKLAQLYKLDTAELINSSVVEEVKALSLED